MAAEKLVEDVARAIVIAAGSSDPDIDWPDYIEEAQAAIRVCMEAAVKVADEHSKNPSASEIAERIRALSNTGEQ